MTGWRSRSSAARRFRLPSHVKRSLALLAAAVVALLAYGGWLYRNVRVAQQETEDVYGLVRADEAGTGHVLDEALMGRRDAETFPAADEDYFHDMDGGVPLTPEEIKGRNTWIVWSAGNDRFWDGLSITGFGALDFLKTMSSHPTLA